MIDYAVNADVRTVVLQCAQRLCAAGVGQDFSDTQPEVARHEVTVLLAEACGLNARDIQAASLMGKTLGELGTAIQLKRFNKWVERREKREPLQHIVGRAPFRYLDLLVGPGVFIPRPETELLIDEALEYVRSLRSSQSSSAAVRIVDLCAGSGALGLAAATEIDSSYVWAVELSEQAFVYAQKNSRRVQARNYEVIQADATLEQTLQDLNGTVDIVLSNPPYIPLTDIPEQVEARESDPDMALYGASDDGMKIPSLIIQRVSQLLKTGGLLLMEHDWSQGKSTCEQARNCGFSSAQTHRDFAGKERYLRAIK